MDWAKKRNMTILRRRKRRRPTSPFKFHSSTSVSNAQHKNPRTRHLILLLRQTEATLGYRSWAEGKGRAGSSVTLSLINCWLKNESKVFWKNIQKQWLPLDNFGFKMKYTYDVNFLFLGGRSPLNNSKLWYLWRPHGEVSILPYNCFHSQASLISDHFPVAEPGSFAPPGFKMSGGGGSGCQASPEAVCSCSD